MLKSMVPRKQQLTLSDAERFHLDKKVIMPDLVSAYYESGVLDGRRELSKHIIKNLATRFNVSPAVSCPA